MTSLDDLTLMQWFVSGDAILEANQSLRVQPANNLRQLLGRKGLLLATAYDAAIPPRIEVRRSTDYTDVLHQILIDHQFMPVGQGLDSQVLCYTYSPIPQGYRINIHRGPPALEALVDERWPSAPAQPTARPICADPKPVVPHP